MFKSKDFTMVFKNTAGARAPRAIITRCHESRGRRRKVKSKEDSKITYLNCLNFKLF